MGDCEIAIMSGGVVVMPTDTIYGLVGSAFDPLAVEKVFDIKKRNKDKPCLVLIANKESLQLFEVEINLEDFNEVDKYWPGPNTIVLSCTSDKFKYLHRGTGTLAFRVPDKQSLRELIERVGPLVAPSANIEGKKPALTIDEAKKYFGNKVACYNDGGKIIGKPSTVISFIGGKRILRD